MIGAVFNGDEENVKSEHHVYQWDTGQKIMISGLNNSEINCAHFTSKDLKTAYEVSVTNSSGTITVDIPDIVLRSGKDVYMYLCIKNSNDDVVTVKTVVIPVIRRNMPENYMYNDDVKKNGRSDVNFYDYDGTLLYSYTIEEVSALTSLPILPSHDGLICQGWNYGLETIKSYGRNLDIGAMYITDDGKTRLYISIESELLTDVSLCYGFTGDTTIGVTIDWGDGTTETVTDVGTLTVSHTYENFGDYVITLDSSENITLGDNSSSVMGSLPSNINKLKKVEIGANVTNIISYAFASCYSLSSMNIPNGVTSIGDNAFINCYSLSSMNIPNGVTSIGDNAFINCYSLSSVTIPNNVTSIGNTSFASCYSLSSISIPNSVTSIGNTSFASCYSLSSISIPNSVTSIGNTSFASCYSLSSVTIPNNVTSIGDNTFYNCRSLSSISIPDNVTSIGQKMFDSCYSLSSISIPNSVTSIGYSAFTNCYSLSSISIPNGVTSIDSYVFQKCTYMKFYDFSTHTSVPTLGLGAFSSIPSDCEIRVPSALYDEWITAKNWSTYASNIVAV